MAGLAVLLLTGCAGTAAPTGAPSTTTSPSPVAPPTGADALAVIETSAARLWSKDSAGGRGSVVPVFRELTWFWRPGGGLPSFDTWGYIGNSDLCARVATGRIEPVPGDLDLRESCLSSATFAEQSAAETAEQEAAEAACPPTSTDGALSG